MLGCTEGGTFFWGAGCLPLVLIHAFKFCIFARVVTLSWEKTEIRGGLLYRMHPQLLTLILPADLEDEGYGDVGQRALSQAR